MSSLPKNISRLRALSLIEGSSLILLVFIAVPLKYLLDMPMMVREVGMGHGILFLMLGFLTLMVGNEHGWKFKRMALIVAASVVPFGCFYVENKVFKHLGSGE
jgi:integral membrane protein